MSNFFYHYHAFTEDTRHPHLWCGLSDGKIKVYSAISWNLENDSIHSKSSVVSINILDVLHLEGLIKYFLVCIWLSISSMAYLSHVMKKTSFMPYANNKDADQPAHVLFIA